MAQQLYLQVRRPAAGVLVAGCFFEAVAVALDAWRDRWPLDWSETGSWWVSNGHGYVLARLVVDE